MNEFILQSNCPACNSNSNIAIGLPNNGFEIAQQDRIFRHPGFAVRLCQSCSLYFKSCIPSASVLDRYYVSLDNSYEDLDFLLNIDKVTIDEIQESSGVLKILDFGCGTGRVLSRISGEPATYGVEVNPGSVEKATSRGIKIVSEQDLKRYEQFFDVILLMDVYEHIYNPIELLKKLKPCLKKGGKMIITTGNADAVILKKYISGYYYFMTFGHLQMLNQRHVQWLARELEFEISSIKKCVHTVKSLKLRLKHYIAILIFLLYKRNSSWSLWNKSTVSFVKNWSYPSFENYTNDHLVVTLKNL